MTDITTTTTTTPSRADRPPENAPTDDTPSSDAATGRQCARCRRHFPIDAGIHPMELLGSSTCPPCTTALLPGQRTPVADPGPDASTERAS